MRKSGFTLVEMAVVLVVIGFILAGVMKGRDLVRSAQAKQYAQGFVNKWVTIAQTYRDKTGQVLFDGTGNGGERSHNAISDGIMDGMVFPKKWHSHAEGVYTALMDAGIDPCTLVKSDLNDYERAVGCANDYDPFGRTVYGEFTGPSTMCVGFWGLKLGGPSSPVRNCVIFCNVPSDLARTLDTSTDGVADGRNGSLVCVFVHESDKIDTDAAWNLVNWENSVVETVSLADWPESGSAPRWCTIAVTLD
ncbi:type II secretion system protein [Desulfobaculum xiamenense]|uniref:type II secretion system protein n=1 Tax=Desulfobaculum xiamenense TaxID=995050 RepID=UPI00315906D2